MTAFDLPPYASGLVQLEEVKRAEKACARANGHAVVRSAPADIPLSRGREWALAALRDEAAELARTPSHRNVALNNAALKLGKKVGAGYLSEEEVFAALQEASLANRYTQEHSLSATLATIRSGLEAGKAEPHHPQERPGYNARGNAPVQPTVERQSRFYSAADLKGKPVPPREWLVPDLVPSKTVTLFSGDGGTGKSLLALQLAVGVVAEAGWIGKPVKQGRVIFLSAEDDDDELHRRLDDILIAEGRDYDDLGDLTLRSLAGEDALLAIEGQLSLMQSELFKELDKRAEEEAPALIVLDTLADVYPANENDRAKVRQFVGILRGLAIRRKCAVMLLGHPSLTGLSSGSGTSGSTAWNNSVRSRLYLSRITDDGHEPDPDARVLTTKKANYSRVGTEINLRWQAGVFVAEEQPQGLDAMAIGAKAERVFLKLLDEFMAQGRYVSASPGPTYAPTQFARHPQAEGCRKNALATAMNNLLSRGEIVIAEHGRGAKARSHLARKGAGHDGI